MANPITKHECPICLEKFSKMKRVVLTLKCSHVYCRKCLRSYVLEQLANGSNIRCPDPDCTWTLDLKGDLKGLVSQKLIKESEKKNKFNGCPVFRCIGTLKDGQCDKCHTKLCFQCGEIEHPNNECNPDIKTSYQQILCDSKSCPNCHVKIYKDGGCDHVHCKKCNKDFDWITMKPWNIVVDEMIALTEQDTPTFNDQQNMLVNIHPLDIVGQFNHAPRVIFQTNQIGTGWANDIIIESNGPGISREILGINDLSIKHLQDSQQFHADRVIG